MVKNKVYKIKSDFDFRMLLPTEETSNLLYTIWGFHNPEPYGKPIGPDFPKLTFNLFVEPGRKKNKERMDFNVSCWIVENFICDYETKLKFEAKFGNKFELFPVETDIDRDFYFVNCLVTVDSIIEEDRQLRYDEPRRFNKDHIKDEMIFRDKVFNSSYYVTEEFVEWVKENDIKGMRFDYAGEMV